MTRRLTLALPSSRRPIWLLAATLGAVSGALSGLAGSADPVETTGPLEALAVRFLSQQTAGLPGTLRVAVEAPRTQPPVACAAPTAFQPPGSRRVGRTTVGVRCTAPAAWTVYLSARVTQIADYAVTTRALPPGHVLDASDLAVQRGDVGQLAPDVVTDPAHLIGQQLVAGLAVGAPLRRDLVRSPAVARQGQRLALIVSGAGFAVHHTGTALANARAGESVRVRSASGQVVSGIAQSDGSVVVSH